DITDPIAANFGIRRFQAERLKCVNGSAIASPADHREMIPVHGPGEETTGQLARHADDKNRIPRAELISVITGQLGRLMDEINRVLKSMGYTGTRGQQVVFTGGGAELAGLADFAQGALGRPVRIGKPIAMKGLAEAHATPGYSTLAGLVLYAAENPVDIRNVGPRHAAGPRQAGLGMAGRVWRALRDYF
ncbi:MAG TPA: cell division FtsA domain-containing protein, partial [Novosphingobium sp.]|nr:cell division FtsA domain-containing protein [Novosphingobium sp.]